MYGHFWISRTEMFHLTDAVDTQKSRGKVASSHLQTFLFTVSHNVRHIRFTTVSFTSFNDDLMGFNTVSTTCCH